MCPIFIYKIHGYSLGIPPTQESKRHEKIQGDKSQNRLYAAGGTPLAVKKEDFLLKLSLFFGEVICI